MHKVSVDVEKNRIYITLGKLENVQEILDLGEALREESKKLNPGFSCITDLREYELLEENYEIYIKGIQEFLRDLGVSKVVRVVRKFGRWGHVQFDKSSIDLGYSAQFVDSMDEAESMLDGNDE
ncbi:MAG: hypothetical protein SWH61_00080 [Thermodesulfobacteriota bacterium]|nr:hypothetical protein [Thermodesulfobacteriota bacterium]